MKIVNINELDKISWDEFVDKHQFSNFFQTSNYFQLFQNSKDTTPIGYAVLDNDEILGVISGVIFKNFFWPLNTLSKRNIVIGGPLIKDNRQDVFDCLMEKFCEHESKKSIFIQIRNIWEIKNLNYNFEKFNFVYEDHLDIVHDLSQNKDEIINKISKNKRGNIHKSENKGTVFDEINNIEDFKKGVDLVVSTYKRIGLPCPSKQFFVNAYQLHEKTGFIKSFGAYADNKIIAMRIEICYKETIYDWYTGNDVAFKNRYPNDVLPFHILLWGKEHGFKKFDFGGAGKPNVPYGVREHKIKFGGELISYGRYEKVNNKLKMSILKFGVNIFKNRKKRKNQDFK